MEGFGWAKNPMVNRIHNLRSDVPITLIYGSRSWNDNEAADIIKEKRLNGYFKAHVNSVFFKCTKFWSMFIFLR